MCVFLHYASFFVADSKLINLTSHYNMTVETQEFQEQIEGKEKFIPPSLPNKHKEDITKTSTYCSEIPINIKQNEPCKLGVDEAGRGPVIGPMVYAISYCSLEFENELKNVGFMDSKVLTHETRSHLLERLCNEDQLKNNIGWATTIMTARDICRGMLKPETHGVYNLNEQAHDTTIALIQKTLDQGVNIQEIYVDTVGPPEKYQQKLKQKFPQVPKITVAKKADSIYPIVSAASICAKVTRDASLIDNDISNGTWGSGYPSDSKTSTWLKNNVDPVFGWGSMIRFSWQTTRDVLEKHNGVLVQWPDDLQPQSSNSKSTRNNKRVSEYFSGGSKLITENDKNESSLTAFVSTAYYGEIVERLL